MSIVGSASGLAQAADTSASAAAAAAAAAVAARLQAGSGSRRASWGGVLAKSGAPVCSMVCWEGPSASTGTEARGASGGFDPRTWPRTLDVRMRVDVHYVVNTVFAAAAPDARAVRWLQPMPGASTPEDEARLADFAAYLAGKGRAGVIKLDPSHPQPPSEAQSGTAAAAAAVAARCGPLALYLVPPSSPVCGALGVPWDGQQQQQLRQHGGRGVPPLLLALVVPQQAAPTGS
ncbi:hypothetical protein DUNSADRAFT_8302 [Dunaliella salina]|uniref:Spen paralogue and orthologue SPOC C-terminal domain-containing protein n=1 Tax=Dunaliella salina TaxID=3046 RepID=A0ABQ7H5U7_DUNSA|nr:hypothetical protein DUNSADRAFT_8302 [Dunaliella salina]|eukprot:KAF5842239.1 hypothetical protein DUNSADRAFT_8302 [Dunaliella salina]